MDEYKYDVALSFASEQREYVEKVAKQLSVMGVKCFYDNNYQVELWGEDLLEFLENVYDKCSRYCVMFISKEYLEKEWTHYERQVILQHFYSDKNIDNSQHSYLLPVRFDDTRIPGITNSWGFISAQNTPPEKLAHMIYDKIFKNEYSIKTDSINTSLDTIYDNFQRVLPYNLFNKYIKRSILSSQKTDAILFFKESEGNFMHYSAKVFLNNKNMLQILNLGFFDDLQIVSEITPEHLFNLVVNKITDLL